MALAKPIRVAIVGTASRASYLYGPLLQALPAQVDLVSAWGRSTGSARRLGKSLGVPWYTDLARLVGETAPTVGIFCIAYNANGQASLEGGKPIRSPWTPPHDDKHSWTFGGSEL